MLTDVPGCDIRVDKEGLWYYQGMRIINSEIVAFLYQHLELDARGRYLLHWRGQRCYLEVEDAPFVVWAVSVESRDEEGEEVVLHLNDGTQEYLKPETFFIGPRHIPYCTVHDGLFRARFSRKAYYQLTEMVEEGPREGLFLLRIGPQRFPIRMESEGE